MKAGAVVSVAIKHVLLVQLEGGAKDWAFIKTRNLFLTILGAKKSKSEVSTCREACCLLLR